MRQRAAVRTGPPTAPPSAGSSVWEEGLASLKLVQMVGLGSDTGKDEFDIHRIAYPGNFLDP